MTKYSNWYFLSPKLELKNGEPIKIFSELSKIQCILLYRSISYFINEDYKFKIKISYYKAKYIVANI